MRARPAIAIAVIAALAVLVAAPRVHAQAPDPAQRIVLTIHLGAETFPSNALLDAGIRESLTASNLPITYFAEYLELEEFPGETLPEAFTEYLSRKYHGRHIDVVIAMTDTVLQYALERRADLFPDAAIVYMGLGLPDENVRRGGAGVTGVQVGIAYKETLELALRLHPGTERVFIVARGATPDRNAMAQEQFAGFTNRITLVYLNEESLASLVAKLRAIPPRSLVMYLWQTRLGPGKVVYANEVAPEIVQATPAPVYGTSDFYVGTGVVGGVVRNTKETGARVGAMAVQILSGTPARDLPVETARVTPIFDWRAMQRWGVNERLLPAGSTVLFRRPSLWVEYRTEALSLVSALTVQALLIAGLLYQRRARHRAEGDSRRNLAIAADANRRVVMSALTGSIAHELSQPLNSILLNAQAAEMLLTSNRATPEALKDMLSDICAENVRASSIIERHRAMLRNKQMDRAVVDMDGVVRESLNLTHHEMLRRQIDVDARLSPLPLPVLGDRVLLQQVLVNLLINAADAMAATPRDRRRIVVSAESGPEVTVSVRDAGTGLPAELDGRLFEPFATTKTHGLGIGLTIVRNIVEAHNGRIEASNNADGGATFTVTLPRHAS